MCKHGKTSNLPGRAQAVVEHRGVVARGELPQRVVRRDQAHAWFVTLVDRLNHCADVIWLDAESWRSRESIDGNERNAGDAEA